MVPQLYLATSAFAHKFLPSPNTADKNYDRGTCGPPDGLMAVSYLISAAQLASDWFLSIIPVFMIGGLQMPRRTKISLSCLLGIGIIASVATCLRLPWYKYYDTEEYPDDFMCKNIPSNKARLVSCNMTSLHCAYTPSLEIR